MEEEPTFVALALGSNLGDRMAHLRAAVEGLSREIRVEAVSSVYASAPAGYADQPDFLNAVVVGRTRLEPAPLLALAHELEDRAGRRRTFANAPRPLDVDVILYGSLVREDPAPVVPHPRWRERAFVLAPLAEVAPAAVDPRSGRTVESLCKRTLHTLAPPAEPVASPDALWSGS